MHTAAREFPDTFDEVIDDPFSGGSAKANDTVEPWWRDPATIPLREFLFAHHYIRSTVGATIAGGARGKTTLSMAEGISMAVGRNLMSGELLSSGPLRVWHLNGEEDQDELDRRAAAVCQHYQISRADLGNRFFLQSVRNTPKRIVTLNRNVPALNAEVMAWMTSFIRKNRIDVFMIDPLVSFHSVSESDNGHMDMVIKEAFGGIAGTTKSAGEVFHHPGKAKPGQVETTVEDARGASAIIWAARSARVLNFMTPEEAGKLGIAEDQRRLHVRIANGKANMGPLGTAKWMKLIIENLPNGDHVAVASSWKPPDPFQGITTADLELAKNWSRTGEYRADSRSPKWFGYKLAEHLHLDVSHGSHGPAGTAKDVARVKEIMRQWLKNKVLATEQRSDDESKKRQFIVPGTDQPMHRFNGQSDDEYVL
jgi:RecA-family ATPase